ncbi:MAG: CPBP family intramembrane metalloprotease [Phycisphaerales bacterium]|nr:MAG: CPBP family intramembrane metalloprotease [Phycisphaerales bacterium]
MFEETPAGALRAAILTAELESGAAAVERLDRLEARDDFPDELAPTVGALRTLYRGAGPDALTPDERDALRDEQGWFADLALGYALDDDDPARAGALGAARRTAFTFFGVLALAGLGGVLGLALAVMFAVQFARRRIVAAYAPPEPGGSVYIEAFAVFLAGLLGVSLLAAAINSATGADITPVLLWLLLLAAFYPLARGVPWAKHKHAIGWTRGKGVVRESFAGVAAYLAGLPIVALGLLGTLLLSAAISWIRSQMGADQGPPMQHPIIDRLGLGGWTIVSMFLLATVWAPLVEETMFRGALYHHMRGRMGPLVSAVLVGFVFAAVHPQGIAAIPALMSLAVVFALMREWRGSVIAPVVAHALHNATLVTAMVLALG